MQEGPSSSGAMDPCLQSYSAERAGALDDSAPGNLEACSRGAPPGSLSGVSQIVTIQQLQQRYTFGEKIGVGGYAVVRKAFDMHTGQYVAIKVVDRDRYRPGDLSLEREVEVLCMLDHPNCVRMHAVHYTELNVYIIMELFSGGELLDRITEKGNYTEQLAAQMITQILEGVAYLHSRGIVHRDLKLENLILENDRDDSPVKIADFGLAKLMEPDSLLKTMCGSPQYVAPEILSVGVTVEEYTPAVDMWSVGVILFILLSGYSPFDDDNDVALFDKIKKGLYDIDDPVWDEVTDAAKDLVGRLLTVDVGKRLSAREALNHPWLKLAGSGAPGHPLRAAHNGLRTGAMRISSGDMQPMME
eukprot:jgi/Tetstr1/421442/TSEL_012391.t1